MADITRGLEGLTFEGALAPSNREVNRLDNLKETGEQSFSRYDNEPNTRFRQALRDIDVDDTILNQMASWQPTQNERMQSQYAGYSDLSPEENIVLEAASKGFGKSRFDRKMTTSAQLSDITDFRARMESPFETLANSFAKMGTLAATTAADSWIGLPAGIINAVANIGKENAWTAFINNPVSAYLQSINEKSEDIFPNYQTAEERNRPWWENIFTTNFIGETLIKNAGFTIGAVVGSRTAVGAIGKLTGAKEARDAFKGLAVELGVGDKSANEVLKMLATGTLNTEKQAALNALTNSARALKHQALGLQIAGGLLAGSGEARIEAINASNELQKQYDELYGDLDIERVKALLRIEEELANKGIDINSEAGQKAYNEGKKIVDANYLDLQEQIAKDKTLVANTVFALNVPLLTAGDMIQWGKLMLGGYNVDRRLVKGIKHTGQNITSTAARTPEAIAGSLRYGVAESNKLTKALQKTALASRNVFVEAQEEMNQSFFSMTAKAKAMGNTTEFMERLYDPMAIHDTVSWLDAAKAGMQQSWLDKDDWVEGFAGGFMGAFGLPTISVRMNEKTGKESKKLVMEGGIWSPLREHKDNEERRKKMIETMNKRLSSPEFLNYYYGRIGNLHFDSIKEQAVKTGDRNLYEKADHAQFINDAMMFANAGRIQDFIEFLDSFENISDEKIAEIKNLFSNVEDIQAMTTAGIRSMVSKNVETAKRRLDKYLKVADDIKVTYGNTLDDDAVAELTWQTVHLDEIEHSLKEILSDSDVISLLSEYKTKNVDQAKDLTDMEIVSSDAFGTFLDKKQKDKNDTMSKDTLYDAMIKVADARWDMSEKLNALNTISYLSSDPEFIAKKRIQLIKKQQELRDLKNILDIADKISQTDKLSEIIFSVEELGQLSNGVLSALADAANNGNVAAKEFLTYKDINSAILEAIEKAGAKINAQDSVIKQANAAWVYLKHNSDTLYDLTKKHSTQDVPTNIASVAALNLLDQVIADILKTRNLYQTIQQRKVQKKAPANNDASTSLSESNTNPSPSPSPIVTNIKTTGKMWTRQDFIDWFDSIQEPFKKGEISYSNINIVDLERAGFTLNGMPLSGKIYVIFHGADKKKMQAYNANGEELDTAEINKITSNSINLHDWLITTDGSKRVAGSWRKKTVVGMPLDLAMRGMPLDKKKPTSSVTPVTSDNKDGDKTSPHKFIAPEISNVLLGSEGSAASDLLRTLPEGAEVHFGMESADGPIYILAGDSNTKIGVLPENSSDAYSGLPELVNHIREEFAQTGNNKNASGMWISTKYVNHIRNKRTSRFEKIDKNVPILDIPGFENLKNFDIVLVTKGKDDNLIYTFSNNSIGKDKLSTGKYSELSPGYVYLLIPNNGKYIPVALMPQNINSETLDLKKPENITAGFGKRLSDTIDKVVDALLSHNVEGFEYWVYNKENSNLDSLQKLLYFTSSGKKYVNMYSRDNYNGNQNWFDDPNVMMVIAEYNPETKEYESWHPVTSGVSTATGEEYSLREQIIDIISNLEYEAEDGERRKGPTVNLKPEHFKKPEVLNVHLAELVEGNLLLTNVKEFNLDNTTVSYVLDYWSESKKAFMQPFVPVARSSFDSKVEQKKVGNEICSIATISIKDTDIKYNLTTGKALIDKKWFSLREADSESDVKAIKKLGFSSITSFFDTVKALAIIAYRYGNSQTGIDRIGNKVLLRRFKGNATAGFIITASGGRFMTAAELVSFKDELKTVNGDIRTKKLEEARQAAAEARREAREQQTAETQPKPEKGVKPKENSKDDFENNDWDNNQEGAPGHMNVQDKTELQKVRNVKEAIAYLKKAVPEYTSVLSYIEKIPYYDRVEVELVKIVDAKNSSVLGQNKFKFKDSIFTNKIVIGENSYGPHTLMHEVLHAFTAVALRYDSTLYEDVQTAMDYFNGYLKENNLGKGLTLADRYAFESPYEFIAEFFSNPRLQELAKNIQMPSTKSEPETRSVFSKIIKAIVDTIKYLFNRNHKTHEASFFDSMYETFEKIVDKQVQLQELRKAEFKSEAEFKKAKGISKSAEVEGVVFAIKVPSYERIVTDSFPIEDKNFVHLSEKNKLDFSLRLQLLNENDDYSKTLNIERLFKDKDLYEYTVGKASLLGALKRDVFIGVRAMPFNPTTDYMNLLKQSAYADVPMIVGISKSERAFYEKAGWKLLDGVARDGKLFMTNQSFTDNDLFKLGSTYPYFVNVLDSNKEFAERRREEYPDSIWERMSIIEKVHARKCLGI